MTATRKYDIVRHNQGLRDIVNLRMKTLGISQYEMCRRLDGMGIKMDQGNLSSYLNGRNPKDITQYALLYGICPILGIKVTLKIESV